VLVAARFTDSGLGALSPWRDGTLAKVLLSCLMTVPCSGDETRMVVSEDTSKKIFTKPSSISFTLEFFLVRGQSVR
jgi:hypothetical protein